MISVCLCLHCFAIFIITMKQWLKRTQSPQTSRGQRSPPHSRQFRQVITRLTDGYTNGHFLAYCLVSKQSSYGIFLNERLLAIDTQARQLRYYSHIPQLPLKHPKDLPSPKQVIAIRAGVQFQIEKVRIGHVSIRWEQNRQPRHWKLIMGNNQIAKDFYELFGKVLLVETQQAKAREVPLGKQYKISTVQTASTPIKQDLFNFKQQIQIRSTPFSQFNFETMKTPQRKDNDLMNQSSAQKLNISLKDSHYFREEGEGFLSSRLKELQIQHSPIILKDDNSLQRTGLLAVQWLQAKNDLQRIAVYSKFVRICSRKVQLMMQNFIATHLMHEQSNKMCLIRDNDIQIYYVPLINSTEEEPFSTFFTNINQETTMIEEWQCLNYLSIFRQTQKMQILVPMTCIISYKSFKFYCKNSLQMYPHKQKLSSSQFQQQMGALQQLSHLPIRNGSQLIYLIQQGNEKLVYLDHVSCLPKITPLLSVSTTYIQLFLTRGVVSNQKDIQAISQHISNKLVRKTLQNLAQKSFTTCCQVMDFIKQSGLSQHYLSFFLNNKQQDYIYLQRLIASQMVACAAEWQIRRRMQTQLFKKRQFGFAINQVRTAVSLLLQEDKYFLGIINQILKAMFNITFPENSLSTFIQSQAMIISLFNRLGFDCRGAFLDADQMSNAWSENYINDYVELTPFINTILIRFDAFSQHHRTLNNCIRPINFEINTQITLEQVLNVLSLRKNASGLYLVSNNYIILPQALKMKVNYYLSHFIAPSFQPAPQQSLQALIYGDTFAVTSPNPHYYTHTIQHLTTLNKVRWLARMKYLPIVEQLLEKQVEQAIIWNQLALLVQIYGFTAKLKLRQGQISNGLQCSLKALQYALKQYEKEPTVLMQLVIAQQAFQAGNFHYNVHNFSKALELYCTVQDILSKISTSGENITLNPQFLDLYVNKCSIHLLFGDYAECFQQCLSSLKSCNKFNNEHMGKGQPLQQQFKIYEILFRCYQIKNMRKQMVQVTSICCLKFFEDSVFKSIQPNLAIFSSLLKMLWMSVIKQIQSLSTTRVSDLHQSAKLKTIYLKKVRKQLKQLRDALNHEHRYSLEQAATFMARKVFKSIQPPQDCRLIMMTIDCLSEVSLNSRSLHSSKLYDKESLQNQWLTLQMMAVLTGYDFLMGAIDDYLRIYDFEP